MMLICKHTSMIAAYFTLLAPPIATIHATAQTAGVKKIEYGANMNNNNYGQRNLQQQLLDMTDILGATNTTCPPDCPLCACQPEEGIDPSEVDANCLLTASIEACASKTFDTCWSQLLPESSGIDIMGLCTVQCDKPEEEITPSFKSVCRICDVFACCTECPSERAAECFPSDIEDGYTPVGWEPATCTPLGANGGEGIMGMTATFGVLLIVSTLSLFL